MTKDKSIFIKNIYYMLSYAFTSLQLIDEDKTAAENFDNVHNLFAAILSRGLSRQLKHGLYRDYHNKKELLSVVRGKIDLTETIRNKISANHKLFCEYDELSVNNTLNRILKTTAELLLHCDRVASDYKNELKKKMLFFSEVEDIDLYGIKWQEIRFNRNTRSYRLLIGICQMIVEGMLLTTDKGEYRLAQFVDDQQMCRLYEKFILEYYSQEHPELKVKSSKIPWALEGGDDSLLPVMQSDIMLESKRGDKILIIDAKYYGSTLAHNRFDVPKIHSANLYQIFTYVKNKDSELAAEEREVSGMLLYAKTDEELQPDNVFNMGGNRISVKTLDLNQEFSKIAEQLDGIVSEHFE